jgi:site-specific recombinase XerD
MGKHDTYQSIRSLIEACDQELKELSYSDYRYRRITRYWEEFEKWAKNHNFNLLTPDIGRQYCIEVMGSDILPGVKKHDQLKLRSIRMLISYNLDGCFEFRSPRVLPRVFQGETGKQMMLFLDMLRKSYRFTEKTIQDKQLRLFEFNTYLESHGILLSEFRPEIFTDFITVQGYTLSKIRTLSNTIKQLFHYLYNTSEIDTDLSFLVMPVSKGSEKLASTYTDEEIRRMILTVDRGSSIGKRDYLVLLLASEYGWRSSDITAFQFSWIDWDKNVISFNQHKTGIEVEYQLIASIGNAIIDYLKYGRPDTIAQEIIVGHDTVNGGKKLSGPTIHSIVAKYFRLANIDNWNQKKHGPHALRFSLATNMLKKNISIPIIGNILGHLSTQSTKRYISLDIDQLK